MATTDALNPNFSLPDMGDYYYDAPDQQMFYAELDAALNPLHRENADETAVAKFYQEEPPQVGAKNETYTFAVQLGSGDISTQTEMIRGISVSDGDTIAIPISMIQAGDEASKQYLDKIVDNAIETAKVANADTSKTKLTIRLAGLDCKELPHFTRAGQEEVTSEEKGASIEEMSKDDTCIWSKYQSFMEEPVQVKNPNGQLANGVFFDYSRTPEKANFVKMIDGCWHQYFSMGGSMYVLRKSDANNYDDDTITDAGIARDVVVNVISQASELRIQVDGAKLSRSGNDVVTMFRHKKNDNSTENTARSYLDIFLDNYTQFTTAGFNYWGLDSYGRAIAVVYAQIGGKWINLNKMVIADTDHTEVNKFSGGGDGAIDTSSYDFDVKQYTDSIYNQSKKFDDRDEVQGAIFGALGKGASLKALKDWTVTIGDVTLFVPPTSIRCLTQSKSQHMSVLRAKGSMAKSSTKMQRIIEMDIFFNEDRGINGYEYKTNTRKDKTGKDVTYWMNGLRALYAEFRIVPFLPITNTYINDVLRVDAVSMLSFSCDTVPNFPKLIKATLQLTEFEYRIYMPEIPWDDGDDDDSGETRNYFAEQINYPLLRYYYQRLLMHGEELKDTNFLDEKYVTSTFGNRTCLVPMAFRDPYIHFYIPNKEQLDKLKAAKILRATTQGNSAEDMSLNQKDKQYAGDLSKLNNEIDYMQQGGDNNYSSMANLNQYLANPDNKDLVIYATQGSDFSVKEKVTDDNGNVTYESSEKAQQAEAQIRDYLNLINTEYTSSFGEIKNSEGNQLFTTGTPCIDVAANGENSAKLSYNVRGTIDTKYMSNDEMKKLKSLAANDNGNFSADEVMPDRTLSVPFSINLTKASNIDHESVYVAPLGKDDADYFSIDNSRDVGMLKAAAKIAERGGTANDDVAEINKDIHLVTKNTLKFEPYNEAEDYLVESIHINTSNSFSQITLQETDGFAPQYVGGTDVSINISMYTRSQQAAASMNLLPSISAEYARNYRLVLTAWPLRIESEFTKMFGITDTMVEAVEVDTVPNYPGLYHIQLSLVSVDRTLRNREAMQKKDMKNFHNLSVEGVAAERTWSYDQLNQYLSEAELYPDLELPTIQELSDAGFNFIRYSNENRVYPDPDFYFTYSYVLVSQIIREAILHGLNSSGSNVDIHDSMGNQMNGRLDTSMGAWEKNYEPDTTDEIQNLFRDDEDKTVAHFITDFINASSKHRDETWTIAPNVKVAFAEKRIINHLNDREKQKKQFEHGQTPVYQTHPTNPNEKPPGGEQQQQDNGSGQETAAQSAYNEMVAKKYAEYTKTVCEYLDKALTKNGTMGSKLEATTKGIYEALGEADFAPYADSKGAAASDMSDTQESAEASGEIGIMDSSSAPWCSGMMDKWLDAAADALCSNGNCDYSPGVDGNSSLASSVIHGAATVAGGVAGAVAGGVVGAGAGAAVGSELGDAANSLAGTDKDSRPWRYKHEWRAKIVYGEGDVRMSFHKPTAVESALDTRDYGANPDSWLSMATYNSVQFGYFDFRFYTEDELASRFGELYGGVTDVARENARFGNGYLADPYYRNQSKEVQNEYVYRCITDYDFAKKAFFRICLLYLRVLISYDIIPSFAYDVFRGALKDKERMEKVLGAIQTRRDKKASDEKLASEKGKTKGREKWRARKAQKAQDDVKKAEESLNKAKQAVTEAQKKIDEAANKGDEKAVEKAKADAKKAQDEVDKQQKAYDELVKKTPNGTDVEVDPNAESQAEDLEGTPNNGMGASVDQTAEAAAAASTVGEYMKLFKKGQGAIDNGKTFLMVLMAVLDGDSEFMKLLLDRRYDSLKNVTRGCMSGQSSTVMLGEGVKSYMGKARSFIRALAGEKVIDEAKIGAGDTEEPGSVLSQFNGRKNIAAAADDPSKYLVHSFYDMVVHDCRGRMLRAFPTFYLILIDEGRKIGRWKLHDNFYNVNSIASITVSKSRKMPTDTAEIVMSNFFNTFTDNDETLNNNYTTNFTDVFRSLWLPTLESYAEEQEQKRTEAGDPERFRIRPGARVHARFGYGADASVLPTMFNGVVAECEVSDTVTLICQSDGVEICKPIMLDNEAYELPSLDEAVCPSRWGTNGATPKQILQSLLTFKGGAINSWLHEHNMDDIGNQFGTPINPLGIYHFGNPDINYAGEPEPMQNILEVGVNSPQDRYVKKEKGSHSKEAEENAAIDGVEAVADAASSVPIVGTAAKAAVDVAKTAYDYVMDPKEPPILNFEVFGKTVWDVLNIVKSVDPSYYAAVVPFHLRSTIFMGRGHDYYAYDYENVGGQWVEKRKPYQQCHIYDSCTDIITNSMKVSTKDIKTCAVGMYEVSGAMNAKVQKKTDPQWVDANIYPEYQKTMYVDTKLFGEPSRKLGVISDLGNFIFGGITNSTLDRAFDNSGDAQNHHATAVKMTIDALKQQMKEMYAGQLTIIGDPTIKPNDRLILNDTYDGIAGQCLVRDVVQVFTADAGFKTVITPDLITAQTGQDAAEEEKEQNMGVIALNAAVAGTAVYFTKSLSSKVAGQLRDIAKSVPSQWAKNKAVTFGKDVGNGVVERIKHVKDGKKMAGLIRSAEGAKNILKGAGEAIKTIKSIGKVASVVKTGATVIGGVTAAGAAVAGGIAAAGSAVVWVPLTIVGTLALGAAEDFIASKFESRKRLVLFPLQKYNKPMVGGVDGNVGTVFGAPNFNSEEGGLTDMLGPIVKRMSPNVQKGFTLVEGLFSEQKDAHMSHTDQIANTDEGKAQAAYRSVNKSQLELFRNAYFNPAKTRLEVKKQHSVKYAQNYYGVKATDQDGITEDPNFNKMKPVIGDKRLKDYFDLGFFRVAAFERGFTSDISDKVHCMYIKNPNSGEYLPVNAIVDESNGTSDIPYLNGDALGVLCDIVKRAFNYMAGTEQTRDAAKWYKDNGESFITLTSALKCGSTKNYESTGFSFVLTASDSKSLAAAEEGAKQVNELMAKGHAQTEQIPETVLDTKTTGQDVFIVVHPPKDVG